MSKAAILCVDDEPLVLRSLQRELHQAFGDQYCYESAENANEALETIGELNEEGIDVIAVVSDWLMPGMKGDDFLIHVHQQFPHIITILLTGQANDEAISRAKAEAALHHYFSKPWDGQELISCLRTGLTKVGA